MNYIYIYIKNEFIENILKYGIKLSEFSNKVLKYSNLNKSGITAFLSPKDSDLYNDTNYSCLKIKAENINFLIYNKTCENTTFFDDFVCDFNDYILGNYEDPIVLVYSTILPEHIQLYNKIQDVPILVDNSKNYYYEKSINNMLESDMFSKYELYQMLLILGEQKKNFAVLTEDKVKIYTDIISKKNYTKRSNF